MTDTDPTQQYGAPKSNNQTQQPVEGYAQVFNNQTGKTEIMPILLPKPYMGNNCGVPAGHNATLWTNLPGSNPPLVQKKKKSWIKRLFHR